MAYHYENLKLEKGMYSQSGRSFAQTYRNMEKTQDRITGFVSAHSKITKERLEELMLDTKMLVKDVGTMLDGPQAVEEGLIDEVGGIARALEKLNELMKKAAGTEN